MDQIDWEKAEEQVNRLQIRIVKATLEQKWRLVKRLQYLMKNSFYAKALAVKRVVSGVIKDNRAATQETLICKLNEVIDGWRITITPHARKEVSEQWTIVSGKYCGDGSNGGTQTKVKAGLSKNTGKFIRAGSELLCQIKTFCF